MLTALQYEQSISITRQHTSACRVRYCYGKSVCQSVTLWYCTETNAYVVKLTPPSSFWNTNDVTKFQELSQQGVYAGWKNLQFLTKITVYLGNGTR